MTEEVKDSTNEPIRNSESQLSPELIKDPHSIVIVTPTYYPQWYEGKPQQPLTSDKLRGDLALKTLSTALNQGYQIALVDSGSSEEFRHTLARRGITFKIQERKGLGVARRQALEIAQNLQGVKVICQIEPEKVSMVTDCLVLASSPILKDEADIVVPKRTDLGLSTLPPYQAHSEQRANQIYNQLLRKHHLLGKDDPDIDFWFGTRVFANRPEIVDLFKKQYKFSPAETALHKIIQPDAYSNPQFFPVVEALHSSLCVKSVEVPYEHPKEQTEFEEGNPEFDRKRDIQRKAIIPSSSIS